MKNYFINVSEKVRQKNNMLKKAYDTFSESKLNLTAYIKKVVLNMPEVVNVPQGYDHTQSPDVTNLTPNITGVLPSALNTLAPGTPGDVIELDGSTFAMSFDKTISGFRGTQENPIWILGNGSTYDGKTLELFDNQWTYFQDINCVNGTANNLKIEQSQDCIYKNFNVDNSTNGGVLVIGTTVRPNARLKFFNFNISNWGTGDGFSLHASGSEEDNYENFIISDLTCQNPVDQAENGLDITSGRNIFVYNYRGIDANAHIAHGVTNVYVDVFNHVFDSTSLRSQSIELRNTDGDIWLSNIYGNGEIDFGVQGGPRSNETPNSTLGLYITYEAKLWNNNLSIDNNTSGSGTITTDVSYNLVKNDINHSGFNDWPL